MYSIFGELGADTEAQETKYGFRKEHSKNQKESLEIEYLRVKIKMSTEGLEEKVEWADKKKKV